MKLFDALLCIIGTVAVLAFGVLLERLGIAPRIIANSILLVGVLVYLSSPFWRRMHGRSDWSTLFTAACSVGAQAAFLLIVLSSDV